MAIYEKSKVLVQYSSRSIPMHEKKIEGHKYMELGTSRPSKKNFTNQAASFHSHKTPGDSAENNCDGKISEERIYIWKG
jgi:hypothetical protein